MEEIKVTSIKVVDMVKELINQGNIRRIIVKNKDGKTIFEVPLTLGIVGIALVPMYAALAAAASLVGECRIAIERDQDETAEASAGGSAA